MSYRLLADAVVLAHLAFIVFVLLGGLLALRFRWVVLAHLPAAAWGAIIEITGRSCPLTPLERWLRRRAGESDYSGGFIEHYLLPIIYPGVLTREIQLLLAAIVIGVNVVVYAFYVRRHVLERR